MATVSTLTAVPPAAGPLHRRPVPWATVLPLAVVLAYADGFWITSMRGAVGAVGRGQGPFTTWWHESTVVIPVYVCAVLGALALALRLTASRGRRGALLRTALLVVAAGTVVGVTLMAVGAAFDYHVQTDELQMMAAMRGDCRVDCLERLRHDTLWLQVRATGLGAGLLLLTNLGVVAWVTMLSGGRLRAARSVRPRADRSGTDEPTAKSTLARRLSVAERDGHAQLRAILATALVGSAVIHLAVVPQHLEEWPAAGFFFVVLTVAQVALAGAVLLRPGATVLLLVVGASSGTLLVWAWSRIWGLPFGPDPGVPEAVGLPDCASGLLELTAVVVGLLLLRDVRARATRSRMPDHLSWLAVVAVLALLVIGVAATQEGWFDLIRSAGADASSMASR